MGVSINTLNLTIFIFRIGQKFKDKSHDEFPGVGAYDLKASSSGPKYSISKGKSTTNFNKNPGPGDYFPDKNKFTKKSPSYSMRKKFENKINQDLPGPGNYDPNINKYKSLHPSFPHSARASKSKNLNPGPGDYDPKDVFKNAPVYSIKGKYKSNDGNNIPGPGNYSPEKNFTTKKYTFSKNEQKNKDRKPSPGPGDYNIQLKYKGGYTMGKRYQNTVSNNTPGPQYEYDYNKYAKNAPKFS